MLTHLSLSAHMTPQTGEAVYPYEGIDTGMAADTLHRTPLTVQQEVPNIGPVLTQPETKVNPTHEQGFGRAPGWQWGWMRKNIPISFHSLGHGARHLGQIRAEWILNSGHHAPGAGKWQGGHGTRTPLRGTLRGPETSYLTVAVAPQAQGNFPIMAWGEPH